MDVTTTQRREAAPSTYDALLYELRTHGVPQLGKPACHHRLAELSDRQLKELIDALKRIQPKYSAITDELLRQLRRLL